MTEVIKAQWCNEGKTAILQKENPASMSESKQVLNHCNRFMTKLIVSVIEAVYFPYDHKKQIFQEKFTPNLFLWIYFSALI